MLRGWRFGTADHAADPDCHNPRAKGTPELVAQFPSRDLTAGITTHWSAQYQVGPGEDQRRSVPPH